MEQLEEQYLYYHIIFYYIFDFYKYYQQKLYGASDYGFDFSDMIYYANKYIERIKAQ